MKNQKLITVATLAGLTLGGLSVTAATADTGGAEQSLTGAESAESVVETDTSGSGGIVLVQDADTPEGEIEDEASEDGRRGHRGGCSLEDAATAIGIDEADLRAAIDNGDTIADVAAANGVDVDVVIDAMVDAKAERIAEKVTVGRVTQDEADEKLADLEGRITDRVNGVEEAPQA